MREYCRARLAHYKVPRYVMFTDEFPMTVTGKVQKFKMRDGHRDRAASGLDEDCGGRCAARRDSDRGARGYSGARERRARSSSWASHWRAQDFSSASAGSQLAAHGGQLVADLDRRAGVDVPRRRRRGLELLHALGEQPVAELGDGLGDLGEAQRAVVEQDGDDRARPAAADQLDRLVVERTAGGRLCARLLARAGRFRLGAHASKLPPRARRSRRLEACGSPRRSRRRVRRRRR